LAPKDRLITFPPFPILHRTLGAGESGKSTILKQMKLIHDGGYTTEERESFKEVIFSNTIQSMRVTLEAMDMMGLQFQRSENFGYKLAIMDAPSQIDGTRLESNLADAVYSLWADPATKQCVARANEFQLNDSAK
jgi:guanine nucleotide-binding protein subunit alpha